MKSIIKGLLAIYLLIGVTNQSFTQVTGNELEAKDVGETEMNGEAAKTAAHDAKMKWWREARFGCFVHWGPSAQLGNEWRGKKGGGYAEHVQRVLKISMADYKSDAIDLFNPTKFDAEEWIDLCKRAGMKYFVYTAKHHDGFAMYNSKVSNYNIVDQTPYHKDPAKMLKDACDRAGIKMGFYYSHAFDWGDQFAPGNDWEWQNPGGDLGLMGGRNWHVTYPDKLKSVQENYVNKKVLPQLQELVTNYDPALLWFDTPSKLPESENQRIIDYLRVIAPRVIVNGRLVRKSGDYMNTGDRAVEFPKLNTDWEAIPTTNESYGWNPLDNSHKTPEFLIQVVAKAISRGGNILLNVGPRNDGSIDPKDVAILEGIGKWMDVNNEAVHGCNASPLPPQTWGAITSKKKILYLHVFDWPKHSLIVGGLKTKPYKATLLTRKGDVPLKGIRFNSNDVELIMPDKTLRTANSVIRLEFDKILEVDEIQLLDRFETNRLLAFDATLHHDKKTKLEESGLKHRDGKIDNYAVYNWTQTEQWISWKVRINKAQRFNLSLRYGIGKGGDYQLSTGDWEVVATAPTCEGNVPWVAKPHVDKLGSVLLSKGVHEIKLRVTKTNGDEVFRPLELWLRPEVVDVIRNK